MSMPWTRCRTALQLALVIASTLPGLALAQQGFDSPPRPASGRCSPARTKPWWTH